MQVRKPIEKFRQWNGDKPLVLKLKLGGEEYTAQPGDWICFNLIRATKGEDRRLLGPVLKPSAIKRLTGVLPDPGQMIVQTGDLQAPSMKAGTIPIEAPRVGLVNSSADTCYPEACVPISIIKEKPVEGRFERMPLPEPYTWEYVIEYAQEHRLAWVVVSEGPFSAGWLERMVKGWVPPRSLLEMQGEILPQNEGLYRVGYLLPDVEDAVLLCDDDVIITEHAKRALHHALASNPQAPAVAPLMNLADPAGLPMPGDGGSKLPRTAGGKSIFDISLALYLDGASPARAHPKNPGCLLVRPELAEKIVNGESPSLDGTLTAMDAYAWRPHEVEGSTAQLVDSENGRAPDWPVRTSRSRATIIASRPRSLPVALYTHVVGPWGGVGALFGVADQLQRHGISASVVYHVLSEHKFRPITSPLKVFNTDALVGDPARALGWKEGVLVGSHWYSGVAAKKIAEKCPDIVPTTFFQDREDWFLDRAGKDKQLKPDQCKDYLAVGRGVSVSRWIIDSLVEEKRLRGAERYEIISCGIDCGIFHPEGRVKPDRGPIRVLAMWRPQTAARRGMPRLKAVYEEIRQRASKAGWPEISLELFGWEDKTGRHQFPPHDKIHGVLSPEEVAALLRQVDILVEPSDYQGLGLPGLEAMACGTALASTQCRGVDEYAIHGENALVVPHDELADAVERLCLDPELRESLREPAILRAREFDWSQIGARWTQHIARLWRSERGDGTRFEDALQRAEGLARETLGG